MRTAALIKNARRETGLTQAELARRLGITQAAVAKLERADANPTVATLDNALSAAGKRLVLTAEPRKYDIDETLVVQQLRRTPAQRLTNLEELYEWARELALAAARARR
jgi:transcriptional regulator with XRE-family HTH domain